MKFECLFCLKQIYGDAEDPDVSNTFLLYLMIITKNNVSLDFTENIAIAAMIVFLFEETKQYTLRLSSSDRCGFKLSYFDEFIMVFFFF